MGGCPPGRRGRLPSYSITCAPLITLSTCPGPSASSSPASCLPAPHPGCSFAQACPLGCLAHLCLQGPLCSLTRCVLFLLSSAMAFASLFSASFLLGGWGCTLYFSDHPGPMLQTHMGLSFLSFSQTQAYSCSPWPPLLSALSLHTLNTLTSILIPGNSFLSWRPQAHTLPLS